VALEQTNLSCDRTSQIQYLNLLKLYSDNRFYYSNVVIKISENYVISVQRLNT